MSPAIRSRFSRKPTDYDRDPALAKRVFLALLSQPLWITRTVESVSLVDRHTARRRISRHYELPEDRFRPKLKGLDLVRLPVFAVPKGQFLSCDLIDEARHYVSLPPLPERAELSAAALLQLAELLGADRNTVAQRIHQFVTAGPMTCHEEFAVAKQDPILKPLFQHAHFSYLATYLANNYVVYIDIENDKRDVPVRRIIRFELDVRFPHTYRELDELRRLARTRPDYRSMAWPRTSTIIDRRVPRRARSLLRKFGLLSHRYRHFVAFDGAGSLHLDVEAAEGIAFAKRKLRFRGSDRIVYTKEAHGASSRRARFLIPRTKGRGSAVMTIYIRPAPGLLRNGAPLLLLGFAALLYAACCEYETLVGQPASVPLIFLLPGLVAVVTARPNEHPYVTSVLGIPRILAITPIPLSIIAAFILIVEGSNWILGVEAGISAALGLILLLGRAIDEIKVKPELSEYLEDDLTRIG